MNLLRSALLASTLACGVFAGVCGCGGSTSGTTGAAGSSGTGAAGVSGQAGAGLAGVAGSGSAAGSTGSAGGSAAGTTGAAGQVGGGGASGSAGGSGVSGPDPSAYTARQAAKSTRYLPLAVGARWGWRVSVASTGAMGMTQSWVEALETLTGTKSGVTAFRVRSTTLTGGTLNWQQDNGTTVVRHREQFSDLTGAVNSSYEMVPSQIRLDETPAHLAMGATWQEPIMIAKTVPGGGAPVTASVSVTWTVEAVNESVTVPAGTFSCLRVHRVEPPSTVDTTGGDNVFWFARGIGKVKETGPELHELLGYYIP